MNFIHIWFIMEFLMGEIILPRTYHKLYYALLIFGGLLCVTGFILDFDGIFSGLIKIVTTQSVLITDYVEVAGMGASLVNAGIVTLISVSLMMLSKDPFNGMTIVVTMIMAGFSLFGKDFLNIWPIIFGTFLYAKFKREPFRKFVPVSLLATALAPLVTYMAFGSSIASIPVGILAGIIVGFFIPPLSAYTFKIQNGINLYNVGFACGLFALMIVPVLTAFGDNPPQVLEWNTSMNLEWGILLSVLCLILLVWGLFFSKESAKDVLYEYVQMLKKSGRAPSDFLRMFDRGPVLVNMAITGLIGMGYILLIDGDLNGPTMGGIFTIMGFSAFGKHPKNMIPVMIGVLLGAIGMHLEINTPALQLAGLFGTTLAPITGQFGAIAGVVVGFIHASLVLQTGGSVAGMNLYNNGFSGGLIAIVAYPILTAVFKRRKIKLRDKEFFELFEQDSHIDQPTIVEHFKHKEEVRCETCGRVHEKTVEKPTTKNKSNDSEDYTHNINVEK